MEVSFAQRRDARLPIERLRAHNGSRLSERFPGQRICRIQILRGQVDPSQYIFDGATSPTFHQRAAVAAFADGQAWIAILVRWAKSLPAGSIATRAEKIN